MSVAPLSQRMQEYFDSDALSTDNMDYQVLIGFKNDVVALEASVGMMGKVIEEWRIQTDSLTPYEARRKSESLEAKLALYAKSGCDLVVCNEPQRCGTVKELEAQVTQLQEEKRKLYKEIIMWSDSNLAEKNIALESRLRSAQELADKLCNSQPNPYDDAYSDSTPYLTMRRQIGRELKKALGGEDAPTKARNGSINPAPEATA